jgi:hypothetical protein
MGVGGWKNGQYIPGTTVGQGEVELPKPAWPTPEQQRQDLHWTSRVPRPVKGDCEDYLLAGRQEVWDAAEARRQQYQDGVAERRVEREQAAHAQRAKDDERFAALQRQAAERREEELRLNHLAAGGTNETWASEGPAILAEDRKRRTLEGTPQIRSLIGPRELIAG